MGERRIDIGIINHEILNEIDEQREKIGIENRQDYLRFLINMDLKTNIKDIIENQKMNLKKFITKDKEGKRIDIRNLSEDTICKIDERCEKYELGTRKKYIIFLVELNIVDNIINILSENLIAKLNVVDNLIKINDLKKK